MVDINKLDYYPSVEEFLAVERKRINHYKRQQDYINELENGCNSNTEKGDIK